MKKGFVFTLDSFFALIAVIVLTGLLVFSYQGTDAESIILKSKRTLARDQAVVDIYLGEEGCRGQGDTCAVNSDCCAYLLCSGTTCQPDLSYDEDYTCAPNYIYPYCATCSKVRFVCEEIT